MQVNPTDDLSPTAARIRDAAIASIAEDGVVATSARRVAARAGVSPALVIHHFGSMADLRRACDEHVAALIRSVKTQALGGSLETALDGIEDADGHPVPLARYLAQVLQDDSPEVAALVDHLVADAEAYLAAGEQAGNVRPTRDPEARAVVLTMWSLGALALHRHIERLLGIDLTAADANPAAGARYFTMGAEILTHGVLDPTYLEQIQDSYAPSERT